MMSLSILGKYIGVMVLSMLSGQREASVPARAASGPLGVGVRGVMAQSMWEERCARSSWAQSSQEGGQAACQLSASLDPYFLLAGTI